MIRFTLLVLALGVGGGALAAPVHYDFDGPEELEEDGWVWTATDDGESTAEFEAGTLVISQGEGGFGEWMLTPSAAPESQWWSQVSPWKGWWVEAVLRVDETPEASCSGSGTGLWIHDRWSLIRFYVDADWVGLSRADGLGVEMDPSDGFHTYRIENYCGKHFRLLVDGVVVFDEPSLSMIGAGSFALNFGNLGGCGGPTQVTWDSFTYDTVAFGVPEDGDGDGVPGSSDNCVDVANADQADEDGDKQGDLCDVCPVDAPSQGDGDLDGDGLCDSDDPCPADPTNVDLDEDGVCDIYQVEPDVVEGEEEEQEEEEQYLDQGMVEPELILPVISSCFDQSAVDQAAVAQEPAPSSDGGCGASGPRSPFALGAGPMLAIFALAWLRRRRTAVT